MDVPNNIAIDEYNGYVSKLIIENPDIESIAEKLKDILIDLLGPQACESFVKNYEEILEISKKIKVILDNE